MFGDLFLKHEIQIWATAAYSFPKPQWSAAEGGAIKDGTRKACSSVDAVTGPRGQQAHLKMWQYSVCSWPGLCLLILSLLSSAYLGKRGKKKITSTVQPKLQEGPEHIIVVGFCKKMTSLLHETRHLGQQCPLCFDADAMLVADGGVRKQAIEKTAGGHTWQQEGGLTGNWHRYKAPLCGKFQVFKTFIRILYFSGPHLFYLLSSKKKRFQLIKVIKELKLNHWSTTFKVNFQ